MRYNWQKFLAVFFIILGTGVVIWAMVVQTRQLRRSQESRSQADENPVVEVAWQNFNPQVEKGKHASMDLYLNSKSFQFSGLELWGSIAGMPQSELKFEPLTVAGLQIVTQEFKTQGDKILFHLVYFSDIANPVLFSTKNATYPIGRLTFTPAQNRSMSVEFDATKSDVASYTTPSLQLKYGSGLKKEFTLELFERKDCNQSCGTDGECKAEFICYEGKCRKSEVTQDDTCGIKPDLGLQRQCNEYCADSRDCVAGFTCWYNYCRNPKNLENTACKNPASPAPRSTTSGTGGARRSPSPTPSPKVVTAKITDIVSKPLPGSPSAVATKSSQVATKSASRTPASTPSTAPKPSIVPLPEELQPGADQPSRWSTVGKVLLGLVLILGLGALIWWWRQHRTPTTPSDY